MSNKDLMTQLQDLQAAYEEKAKKIGRPAFVEMAGKLFAACPTLGKISWTQYAPGFNDGDPCVFSVHGPEFYSIPEPVEPTGEEGVEEYDEDYDDDDYGNLRTYEASYAGAQELREFQTFLNSTLGEDLCGRVFGESAKVVICRDGTFKVDEDYSCGY